MSKIIFGQLGRLKREKIEEYEALHANPWPEVLKTIHDCNLQNYSIFRHDDLVFAYFDAQSGYPVFDGDISAILATVRQSRNGVHLVPRLLELVKKIVGYRVLAHVGHRAYRKKEYLHLSVLPSL